MRFNPLRNLWLKLSAVALALLLWVHVETNKTYEYQIELPLKVSSPPKGLVLTSNLPSHVTLRLKATGKQLFALENSRHEFILDISQYEAGKHERTITGVEAISALGRRFEEMEVISPRSVELRFEHEVEKKLPVIVSVQAAASAGYAVVSQPRVEPDSVQVKGPGSVMQRLRSIETSPERFSDLVGSISPEVMLLLPDSLHLSVADSSVVVKIGIEQTRERTFANVPIVAPGNLNLSRYQIIPSHLNLIVNIPLSKIDNIDSSEIFVSFKRPSSLKDSSRVALEYQLPEFVALSRIPVDSVLIVRKS